VLELAEPYLESSFFSVAKNFLSINTTENSAKFFSRKRKKLLPLFGISVNFLFYSKTSLQ